MADPTPRAVFLSYASQDAPAVERLAVALRAAGVEVWFDRSELVGGDAWDAKIRKQIAECALFVPVISAATQARHEGYFRLEWKLAAQRTHMMSGVRAFLLPVVIDDTRDAEAHVPEEFRAVQWTRLSGEEGMARLSARVQQLLEVGLVAPPARPELVTGSVAAAASRSGRRILVLAGLAGCGALAALAGFLALRNRPVPVADTPVPKVVAEKVAPVAVSDKSIAVLPFANLSDDKESGYFADGVHEDLLTGLANIPELRLVSRTSVMRFRETKKSMREIADELGVTYVLEGSVRRAGQTVRVTGQLIRAASDEHVWARNYDRELKDVFAIQAALATEIAQALQAAISPHQQSRLERAMTSLPAAYDLLLRAREVLNRNVESTQETFAQAEAFLRSAVELDPHFAVAWSYLGDVHAQLYFHGYDRTEARRALAGAAIEQARKLEPERPEVLRNTGAYHYHAWRDFARAGEFYHRALALQPNDCETRALLALQLRRLGRWEELLTEARRAFELDPMNAIARPTYIFTLINGARRYDEAMRALEPLGRREPNPLGIVRIAPHVIHFFATGSTRAVAEYLDRLPETMKTRRDYHFRRHQLALFEGRLADADRLSREQGVPWESPLLKAAVQIALGEVEAARAGLTRWLTELTADLQRNPGNPSALKDRAMAAALLGQREAARGYLRQAQETIHATKDRMDAADLDVVAATVLLWTGDKDGALRELTRALVTPGPLRLNVHQMRHSPVWAPLHGDARFEALLNDPRNNAQLF